MYVYDDIMHVSSDMEFLFVRKVFLSLVMECFWVIISETLFDSMYTDVLTKVIRTLLGRTSPC